MKRAEPRDKQFRSANTTPSSAILSNTNRADAGHGISFVQSLPAQISPDPLCAMASVPYLPLAHSVLPGTIIAGPTPTLRTNTLSMQMLMLSRVLILYSLLIPIVAQEALTSSHNRKWVQEWLWRHLQTDLHCWVNGQSSLSRNYHSVPCQRPLFWLQKPLGMDPTLCPPDSSACPVIRLHSMIKLLCWLPICEWNPTSITIPIDECEWQDCNLCYPFSCPCVWIIYPRKRVFGSREASFDRRSLTFGSSFGFLWILMVHELLSLIVSCLPIISWTNERNSVYHLPGGISEAEKGI